MTQRSKAADAAGLAVAESPVVAPSWAPVSFAALSASAGLLVVALGDSLARATRPEGETLFWVGIALITVPVIWALLSRSASRSQRISLVLILCLASYLVKVLHSPSYFTLVDETLHYRTATDVVNTGSLFLRNPLLVVSPIFPALEISTSAVANLAGVSIFQAAISVVAVGRGLLALALFLLFEEVSRSPRIAGLAVFVYAVNQNFVFFDSQFAYESLALPLAVTAIYAVARWQRSRARGRRYALAALALIATVVVAHHLTTYVMVALLLAWVVASRVFGRPGAWRVPAGALLFTLGISAAWIAVIANDVIPYMAPRVQDALDLVNLIVGDAATRPLFQTTTGVVAPLWERGLAIFSVIVIIALLPFGLWRIWRNYRDKPLAIALAAGALGYPGSLALRLSAQGSEEATRAPEFVFIGVAFVAALVMNAGLRSWAGRRRILSTGAASAAAGLVFAGGIIVGIPRWARMPGPYLPAADPRSIEAESIQAATWALQNLGPHTRIVADRINRNLMGGLGEQDPVTSFGDDVDSWRLFYTPSVDNRDREIIRDGQIKVLVADLRLTTTLPLSRVYYEAGEPHMFDRTEPLDRRFIDKWNNAPDVSRFFDSGDIEMFDVTQIRDGH